MNLFDDTDLIITTGGGKVQSGGFTILNRLLNNRVQPMYTINNKETTPATNDFKKLSYVFEGLVVPIGLHVFPYDESLEKEDNSSEIEEKDLYDSLLALSEKTEPNSSILKRKSTKKHLFQLKQPPQRKTKKIKPDK